MCLMGKIESDEERREKPGLISGLDYLSISYNVRSNNLNPLRCLVRLLLEYSLG